MIIELENVVKKFGRVVALNSINLKIDELEKVALLGPNGAGKTTLVRIISGITKPTSGKVRVFGKDPTRDYDVKRKFGVVSHNSFLYDDLTALENLEFYAKLYNAEYERIDELLEMFELKNRKYDLIKGFSRGMRQRLSIVRALLHNPDLLILDEPTSGLDIEGRKELLNLLSEFNGTLLLTTHTLEEAIELCEKAVIISSGMIVFQGEIDENLEERYLEVVR